MIPPEDERHGTTRGHSAGCRQTCCREARNYDEARRRKYRQALGIHRRVPALGTQRRIRALMALGWTSRHIADHCGWATTQAVTELLKQRRFVFTGTAEKVATVYDALSMQLGPSEKNRRDATRKGWPPPLAWNNPDDPNEHPTGWQYKSADRATLIQEMADRGDNRTEVERALKVSTNTLNSWCINHGLSDAYRLLASREGDWNARGRYGRKGTAA